MSAEEKLDKIIKDFGDATKTDKNNPGDDLRKILDASPDLKKRILDAVDKGVLTGFKPLPPNSGAGGSYDPTAKAINLPMDVLKQSGSSKPYKAELIFVMGHEIQHSFNAPETAKTTKNFIDGVEKLAQSKASPHDYTKLIEDFTEASRRDEASANIGGYNAIVSQIKKSNPKATLEDIYNAAPGRMDDFIDVTVGKPKSTYTMKSGLTVDADLHMSASKDNVTAMGKYYFDKPAANTKLGPHHNLDYPGYYGAWAVSVIGEYEKAYQASYQKADKSYTAPAVQFDMKRLGLKENLVEQDLKFSDDKAFPYVDTSDGKTKAATFDPQVKSAPSKSHPVSPLGHDCPPPNVPGHKHSAEVDSLNERDRALFDQAFFGIGKLKGHPGLANHQMHENAAAATALEAKFGGMNRIDQVLQSTKDLGLFAIQSNTLGPEHNKRVYVDVQALQRPIEKSLAQLSQPLDQQLEQQPGQAIEHLKNTAMQR